MPDFSDQLNEYYRRLCKFLKNVLPEDDGVDNFISPEYADKARNALAKDNVLVLHGVFGINMVLGWLEFLALNDRFEQCIIVRDYIGEINKRKVKFPLPKSLDELVL